MRMGMPAGLQGGACWSWALPGVGNHFEPAVLSFYPDAEVTVEVGESSYNVGPAVLGGLQGQE